MPQIWDNKILKCKQARFGAIDQESNYFIEQESHSLLDLFALRSTTELRAINIQESSIADWQK